MGETRSELAEKIRIAKDALMFSGPMHRRDLQKHIRRMEKELRDYDRFQEQAKRG